jgi:hypothetical protein
MSAELSPSLGYAESKVMGAFLVSILFAGQWSQGWTVC